MNYPSLKLEPTPCVENGQIWSVYWPSISLHEREREWKLINCIYLLLSWFIYPWKRKRDGQPVYIGKFGLLGIDPFSLHERDNEIDNDILIKIISFFELSTLEIGTDTLRREVDQLYVAPPFKIYLSLKAEPILRLVYIQMDNPYIAGNLAY